MPVSEKCGESDAQDDESIDDGWRDDHGPDVDRLRRVADRDGPGSGNGNGTGGGNGNGDGSGGGNGGGNGDARVDVVNSGIAMHVDKRIAAGDDLVVYGTGPFAGVDYIVPSGDDTAGRGIPDGDTFVATAFAVTGKKIALIASFEVTIYDTVSERAARIPVEDIRVTSVPVGIHDAGHLQADGDYVICRSDESTTDGRFVKVVDVSGDDPVVIPFAENPSERPFGVQHVLVDADTDLAVATADGTFFVYDINNPQAAPDRVTIETGIGDSPPAIDHGMVLFQNAQSPPRTMLLDLETGELMPLDNNPSARLMALADDAFGYFFDGDSDDSLGTTQRSAIGRLDDVPQSKLAASRDFIDGSTPNNGALGYGESITITPDGAMWFIAGTRSVDATEYLQLSTGEGFRVVADPDCSNELGCLATDVSSSHNTVAFKTRKDGTTVVGYIVLDEEE